MTTTTTTASTAPHWDQWFIILFGEDGVGRKVLAVQFTMNCFVATYDPFEEGHRKYWAVDGTMCLADVEATTEQLIREGQGFFLIYSVTSRTSFSQLDDVWQSIQRAKGKTTPIILLGNKCDLGASDRTVTTEEGTALARQFGCPFLEVSAKTGVNYDVERAFSDLVRLLRQSLRRAETATLQESSGRKEMRKGKCIIL
ncbi:P-loop containing nucleoside triphosphate hydrolase protein [Mycena rosella]|uniref:P-loop containing nucleoside triphosphate hydrolase protein n=1 Tax=Mycena rosella TaxID=1033263 RepID=A0AAD7CVQ7_MYCRO|nr:P-loop containing nucleoside triphosphate hydrolase protein [Mycena rosella]